MFGVAKDNVIAIAGNVVTWGGASGRARPLLRERGVLLVGHAARRNAAIGWSRGQLPDSTSGGKLMLYGLHHVTIMMTL